MKIAVMGAGAVGGYFGALLKRGGLDVILIARGEHLDAIRARGLVVKSVKGDFTVRIPATDAPGAVGPVDLILFCVKSYDTEKALHQARPMVGAETVILSLQNGVDNEDKIAAVVGEDRVLGGVAYIGAGLAEPGVIRHAEEGRIVFGELQGGVSDRVRQLAATFNQAGLPAEASADIRAILWGKLCWNAAFNAINTLVGGQVRRLVEEPQSRELCRRVMEEVRAVAISQGVPLPETVIDKLIRWTEGVDVLMVTSTRQDLEAGKPLEADALNGVVVRKGKEAGVPTPYNFTLYTLLKALSPTP